MPKTRHPSSVWIRPNLRAALDAEAKKLGLKRSGLMVSILMVEMRARGYGDVLDREEQPDDAGSES